MKENLSGKRVNISFNTTEEHLKLLELSIEDVKELIGFMTKFFGTQYLKLFPTILDANHISNFKALRPSLYKVRSIEGVNRLIRQMNRNNFAHHMFTVRVAGWLLDLGYEIELEPEPEAAGGSVPDILLSGSFGQIAIECKDIDLATFFARESKKEIADYIYDTVKTCDQIDLYFNDEVAIQEIKEIFSDIDMVSTFYKVGFESPEARFSISPKIEVNIIRKPAIIGAEKDFFEVTMEGYLESTDSSIRLPGFSFMKGGRSVGVWGPPPNLNRRWNDKRSQSKKQAIDGLPLLVMINGDNVIGDPKIHLEYFERDWLTPNNSACSAIGIIKFVTLSQTPKIDYFENSYASVPISDEFKSRAFDE